MIIWRGWGILTLIIWLLGYFLSMLICINFTTESIIWPTIVSCIISTPACFFAGKALNKRGNIHTLFFIPMQYWAFIFPVLFIILFFVN